MPPIALKDSTSQLETFNAPAAKSVALREITPVNRIIDIRREKLDISLEDDILKGLIDKGEGEKSMPTLLLYSEEGLKLFEEITYLDEYYLTNNEIEVLTRWSNNIAERIEDGSVLVELGSGNLRKVNIFLKALDKQDKKIDYYALDLNKAELNRTLSLVDPTSFQNIRFFGLHGTYEDGRMWLKSSPEVKNRPRCVIWLGSSAGNFERTAAAQFLKGFADDALRPGKPDYMLVGLDGCKDGDRVHKAYNDTSATTEKFIKSSLKFANKVLGAEYFDHDEWEYLGEWNVEHGRHQAYLVPKNDIKFSGKLKGVVVKSGECIHIEYSYKFDDYDARLLWKEAGLIEGAKWASKKGDYRLYFIKRDWIAHDQILTSGLDLHLLRKQKFDFAFEPSNYVSSPIPTLAEWKGLWSAWDTITLGMIPKKQLSSKPIDLRNPCIFYLGHIPTFLDSLLMRCVTNSVDVSGKEATTGPTEPVGYLEIFQRGVDPDVDNPGICHLHSKIPNTWPDLDEVLDYGGRVRKRLQNLYRDGSASHQPDLLQRAIWTGFEHEVMHTETLLYMLIQTETTLAPPGSIKPDFVSGRSWERCKAAPNDVEWHTIPATTFTVGLDDPEDRISGHLGWDNEKPARLVTVDTFVARSYPITNEEYAAYLLEHPRQPIPASWVSKDPHELSNGDDHRHESWYVRTVFGPVPLDLVPDWPVMASYDELLVCAKWMGGRIPTANEVRAIYNAVDARKLEEKTLSRKISAVNGHLIHNGVCETPPSFYSSPEALQHDLYAPLTTCNVGYRHWHPTSVRSNGGVLLGRGETGGAWEWTSTPLTKHEGFEPGRLYPEYSADFFDGKHNIVLGGSWATHPRVAGRKSFVNWYQRNYRYAWSCARIVKDVDT